MKHSIRRRLVAAVALAAASAVALSGCGSSGSSTLDVDAPVTITWWTGQPEDSHRLLVALAEEFEAEHPNVTIDIAPGAPTTDDLLQKILAGFVGGSYPDISYAYGSWAGELAASGRMQDISERIADPAVKWDEFPTSGRETVQPEDAVIGFPALIDNLSLLYNKTLFDEAGLEYPTNDWTWDDFREAAAALTDASTQTFGTAYPVSGTEDTTWRFWPMLWQNGGEILSADGATAAFDSPAGVAGLEVWREMAVEDGSVYLDQTGEKFEQLFVSGRIGLLIDGPWLFYDVIESGIDYGVAFLPGTDGDHATISGPDIWALFDHDDANRAYWSAELIQWITSAEQDARYSLALGNLPLRPEAEERMPEFQEFLATYPGVEDVVANFENVTRSRPTVQGYTGVSEAVADAIVGVLQGQGTSAEALAEAAEAADQALAKAR